MKKGLILVLALTFVMALTFGVLAENGDDGSWSSAQYWDEYDYDLNYNMATEDKDGLIWKNVVDPEGQNGSDFVNLVGINRQSYTVDKNRKRNDDDQELEIKIPVVAYIPCYLEITLTGNEGHSSFQSFGPDSFGSESTNGGTTPPSGYSGYQLLFDNEVGGFVDDEWKSLGSGKNAEIEPGSDIFIAGCDIFAVGVYGNDDYTYEVQSSPLDGAGSATLNMYIRTSMDLGDNWPYQGVFDSNDKIAFDKDIDAGDGMTFLHNFKVPYSNSVAHGSYSGEVIFRVVTR